MENLLKKSIKEYQKFQDLILKLKKISDQILAWSKKAIALLRRNNLKESESLIKEVEKLFGKIKQMTQKNKKLQELGFYKEALEEYLEALTFYNFLNPKKKKIPDFVKARAEEVIGGICDFTGELVRKALTEASLKNLKKIEKYQKKIEQIVEQLTRVGFRGKLRQKYDEVERNLKNIEKILYDLRLKR